MKHKLTITCILLLALSLTACTQKEVQTVYSVGIENMQFTVDTQNMTISDGMHIYQFEVSGGNTTITYPNGATFYWTQSGNISHGGWSEDYDDSIFADGHTLLEVLEQNPGTRQKRERSGNPLVGLLFIGLGLWNVVSPYSSWYFSYGWRYKEVEPSDAALGLTRFGGIVAILVGVVTMIV